MDATNDSTKPRLMRRNTLSEVAIDTITGESVFEDSVKKQGGRLRRTMTVAEEKFEDTTGIGITLGPRTKNVLGQATAGVIASAVVSPAMTVIDLAM